MNHLLTMSLIVVVYAMVNLSMMPRRTPKVMMPRMIQTTTKWPEQQSRPLSPSGKKEGNYDTFYILVDLDRFGPQVIAVGKQDLKGDS